MTLAPITLRAARAFVDEIHRHHKKPQGGCFAISARDGERICGVVIVGRPLARLLQDGYTAEVTRVATDGTKNACSALYGAAWRAARAMGYRRLVTYILDSEPGTTLKASGWREVAKVRPECWNRPSRKRRSSKAVPKRRYEVAA